MLPYNEKKELFQRLSQIAHEVENALDSNDLPKIGELLCTHNEIMNVLSQSEAPLDKDMKPAIEDASRNVRALITKIQDMQTEIKNELMTMNKKKLIQSVYSV